MRDGQLAPDPVLDISSMVNSGGNEQGLLGLAFSPAGSKLYVHYSDDNGNTQVDEYAVGADGAIDSGSRRAVLSQEQPQSNHNGGQLAFGPDGMLYLGLGDGGGEGCESSVDAVEVIVHRGPRYLTRAAFISAASRKRALLTAMRAAAALGLPRAAASC